MSDKVKKSLSKSSDSRRHKILHKILTFPIDNSEPDKILTYFENLVSSAFRKRSFNKPYGEVVRYGKAGRYLKLEPASYKESQKRKGYIGLSEKYPVLNNIFFHYAHKFFVLKDSSKEKLNNPWRILDGLVTFLASDSHFMPYKWESTIKIQDALGEDVCLIHHKKRGLAKLIACAPDLYSFILYIYINREALFPEEVYDEPKFKEFFSQLESLIIALIPAYGFKLSCLDPDSFYEVFYRNLVKSLFETINIQKQWKELEKFLNGKSSRIEEMFWMLVRRESNLTIKAILDEESMESELVADMGFRLVSNFKDSSVDLNKDNLTKILTKIINNNLFELMMEDKFVRKEENGLEQDDLEYIPLYSPSHVEDLKSLDALWNKDGNLEFNTNVTEGEDKRSRRYGVVQAEDFDRKVGSKLRTRADWLDEYLVTLGVRPQVVYKIPEAIKLKLYELLFKSNRDEIEFTPLRFLKSVSEFYNDDNFLVHFDEESLSEFTEEVVKITEDG